MSPELYREFQELKETVRKLQSVTDPSFIEGLNRRLSSVSVTIEDGASTTNTTIAVRNAADTGSETVAEEYTGVATLYVNGVALGRIGYY